MDWIAELGPDSGERHQVGWVNQVDFVDHDHGLDTHLLSRHQQAVDQIRFDVGLGRTRHDQREVDVGSDDLLLPFAGSRNGATVSQPGN